MQELLLDQQGQQLLEELEVAQMEQEKL